MALITSATLQLFLLVLCAWRVESEDLLHVVGSMLSMISVTNELQVRPSSGFCLILSVIDSQILFYLVALVSAL